MREASVSEALARKYPEWIVLVTTRDPQGRANVMPAGWAMIASASPPMLAIALHHNSTTNRTIKATGEFVVAFPAPGMEAAVDYTGSCHGADVDKFATGCLATAEARHVKAPLIVGAVANMECLLRAQVEAGDHTVFIGGVVASYVDDAAPARLVNFGPEGYGVAVKAPAEGRPSP